MEIERKFLADPASLQLDTYPRKEMSQGYISTDPVIRIRRSNDNYILTVKSGGLLEREEFETALTSEQYDRLSAKVEGTFLTKTRYLIPYHPIREINGTDPETATDPAPRELTIELDVFHGSLSGLVYAEVEFTSVEEAKAFIPPKWFLREVTEDGSYTNAALSRLTADEIPGFLKKAALI